jgi:glutathione synthase/RimK-type ligase-like ATP-grasp enzyme
MGTRREQSVIFATCQALPDLDPDDRLAAEALERRGITVAPAVWNDPAVDWASPVLCVIRSTWDYHRNAGEFLIWVERVSAVTRTLNPAPLVRWNSHKSYLRDLESAGIPVVPTEWVRRQEKAELEDVLARRGWREAVVKPAYGAAGDGLLQVNDRVTARTAGQRHLHALLEEQDVLVQPYLNSLKTRHERALVFIEGAYSHAASKPPQTEAIADISDRRLLEAGAVGELAAVATDAEIDLATRALGAIPKGHLYARVDIVRDNDGNDCIIELELIEPSLFFFADSQAPGRFAHAIVRRLAAF